MRAPTGVKIWAAITTAVTRNFIYNPPSRTILSVGTHTLDAAFTQTDTTDYNIVSASVVINVTNEHQTNEHQTSERDNNSGPDDGNYGKGFEPNYGTAFVPISLMMNSPMYGSEPNMYKTGPSTAEIQNSESKVHKTKAHLNKHKQKHKHKHHTTKHQKTGKNT